MKYIDAVEARVKAAREEVYRLSAWGGRKWTMSIPVQEDRDSDRVIINALADIEALLRVVRAAKGYWGAPRDLSGELEFADGLKYADDLEEALAALDAEVEE